jgi:hypothetical protein
MLTNRKISDLAADTASGKLGSKRVLRATTVPFVDSRGNEALRITIVVQPGTVEDASGDDLLDILVEVQERLGKQRDSRFAVVEYATPADLIERVDP